MRPAIEIKLFIFNDLEGSSGADRGIRRKKQLKLSAFLEKSRKFLILRDFFYLYTLLTSSR
jgi:hypothetical protein